MVRNVKGTLSKIVSKELEKFGFIYDPSESDGSYWTYTRRRGELQELIGFNRSVIDPNEMSMFLSTSNDRVGMMGTDLIGKAGQWWSFEDQDSLENVIKEMLDILVEKGIEWFDISSTPIPNSSEVVGRRLFEDPQRWCDKFQRDCRIEVNGLLGLQQLESLIQENKKNTDSIDWEFVIGASAFYGETLRSSFGGQWSWDPDFSEPCLIQLGENPDTKEHLIYRVLYYRTNKYHTLVNHFLYLRNAMQMPHIYEARTKFDM